MYRKNTASQYIGFTAINASTGATMTGTTGFAAYRVLDGGAQASATGSVTDKGNGQYSFALSQADTNGNDCSILFTMTSMIAVEKTFVTTACDPTVATNFGITALPAVATGNAGAVLTSGTGTAQLSVSAGLVVLAGVTHTGAVIPTVTTTTNLTNAATAGDFTATQKASIGTAVAASAVASVTGAVGSVTGNVGGNVTGSVGSVVGAVGSVAGNVGGNVAGSVGSVVGAVGSVTGNVGGDVTGSVGSVVGAVGSVTGNVGGNVTGSVGGVAAGGITSTSFGAGAITATVIATDAIDADALAADAVTEIWAKAMTELSGVPAVNDSAIAALSWCFEVMRNKMTQTSGTTTLLKDDGTTTLATSAVTDDGTTFTRSEWS